MDDSQTPLETPPSEIPSANAGNGVERKRCVFDCAAGASLPEDDGVKERLSKLPILELSTVGFSSSLNDIDGAPLPLEQRRIVMVSPSDSIDSMVYDVSESSSHSTLSESIVTYLTQRGQTKRTPKRKKIVRIRDHRKEGEIQLKRRTSLMDLQDSPALPLPHQRLSARRSSLHLSHVHIPKLDVRIMLPYMLCWVFVILVQAPLAASTMESISCTLLNLFLAGLVRHSPFLYFIYYPVNLLSRRKYHVSLFYKVIHCIGGFHSASATCAVVWLFVGLREFLILEIVIGFLLFVVLIVATSPVREKYHNVFEQVHRLFGWIALIGTWIVFLKHRRRIINWLLLTGFTYFVMYPWIWVQVKYDGTSLQIDTPSEAITIVSIKNQCISHYDIGTVLMLSLECIEWHPFASIQSLIHPGWTSFIISSRGDWTKSLARMAVEKSVPRLFVRAFPKPNHGFCLHGFGRVLVCVSGGGLGAVLQAVMERPNDIFLLWIARDPFSYGEKIVKMVENHRYSLIHVTGLDGRPNVDIIATQLYNIATKFEAEAVFLNSNKYLTYELTKKCCEELQIVCFGSTWDH